MLTYALLCLFQSTPPTVVDHDNIDIKQSCTIAVESDFVADADNDGVLHITADGVVVDFGGQTLRGTAKTASPDQFAGIGIRITAKKVTLKNANVAGFKCAIWASNADGLLLENCDLSDNYAQHLKSTPKAEDGADWLYPHHNDKREWMTQHGAGVYVERSTNVTIGNCRARRTQNGLLLDRVTHSKVYDNDFSFLSGWGLGMWRCEDNLISRNAFDFCVRGYSHRVYNRGQDSAGILFFEQNMRNVIVENSATHGGDGFFGFAGREALGEAWWEEQREKLRKELGEAGINNAREKLVTEKGEEWKKRSEDEVVEQQIVVSADLIEQFKRRGNCDNVLAENDFSDAVAHGIESTFSFGNVFYRNRMTDDAICGIWGGYSQDTLIVGNIFERCGAAGYGLERGGVNIEHGRGNVIRENTFTGNVCGVHLWWDADEGLLRFPWAKANGAESTGNIVIGNQFTGDELALHLRESKQTIFASNRFLNVKKEVDATPGSEPITDISQMRLAAREVPKYEAIGEKRSCGSRKDLGGRDRIIIAEWGPYDWEKPFLMRSQDANILGCAFRYLGKPPLTAVEAKGDVTVDRIEPSGHSLILVTANAENAVVPFELRVRAGNEEVVAHDVLVSGVWQLSFFRNANDPRKDYDAWTKEAQAATPVRWIWIPLNLRFGSGGPADLDELKSRPNVDELREIGRDHFGTLATTALRFPAGKWRITVTSDDGVHVFLDDKLLIDDWTWHGPKTESKEFTIEQERVVNLRVEHFELDGYAILSLNIEKAD